jgi:glycosyltransferase involved in cell wall biosynthesis
VKALVIADEPFGDAMAGNAIRSLELAKALRRAMEVTVVSPRDYELHHPVALKPLLATHDLTLGQPAWPLLATWLRRSKARVIYDLYDPEPLEALEFLRGSRLRRPVTAMSRDRLRNALHDGHAFLCASRAQRELYSGMLLAEGLLTPRVYDADPALANLLATVPFGVADEPPRPGPGPRAKFGLAADDEVILWNGGLWAWLDPVTAVRAVATLARTRPKAKLVFMGFSSAPQSRAAEARRVAAELGAPVYFNDTWVPYSQRGGWLLDADCALSTHVDHLETRFAFRTRLLDCFWAQLPIVCTAGDELADVVAKDHLGAAVAPGDVDAVVAALDAVLERGRSAYAEPLARTAARYRWSEVTKPLVELAVRERPLGRRASGLGLRARDAAYRTASTVLAATGRDMPRAR